ncbi:MAG: tRNA adenosine(34) deaminase TadA [Gammaproteobacteria bacterium]|nr:MAG: tRNA adenosine(34) deaminase TadA [Gammaproteobacteria bacterium]|tara:strand:+ start:2813 stop:3277 length:465 start_codon:yes stop_codon:yes gene_type:complete
MIEDVDVTFMRQAIELARKGGESNEVPVGAVVTFKGEIIGKGFNQCIQNHDPTAHAEIIAIRAAAKHVGNYRLNECNLYVTLEPCLMCFGALVHARISKLIYGADDIKTGALQYNKDQINFTKLNHKFEITSGILKEECAELLSSFFKEKRLKI